MKRLSIWGALVGLFIVTFTPTFALSYTIQTVEPLGIPYTYSNSGTYLGTVIGENDSLAVVEGVLSQLNIDVDLIAASTVNYPDSSSSLDFPLYVTYADGNKSGQWATYTPVIPSPIPDGAALVDFYVVKGGNDFALYFVDPAAAYGTWNVENLAVGNLDKLNTPAISHFAGYSTTAPVPEPATMLLLGSGLIGLIGFRKKFRQ